METNTIYDVAYFINKFEAIPSDDIGDAELEKHCTLWHCGIKDDMMYGRPTEEALALAELIKANSTKELDRAAAFSMSIRYIWTINDDVYNHYSTGNTPKERILNYLYQIRDKESIDGQTTYKKCGEGLNEEDQLGE